MKKNTYGRIFVISPTESILTKQGNRHPSIADYYVKKGLEVIYYSSNFYHAEKRFFSSENIKTESNKLVYELNICKCLGYKTNISIRRVLNNILLAFKIFFLVLKRCKSDDIILLPSRPVEFIYLIALIKKIKKCTIILDVEDIWPDALVIKNKFKKSIFRWYCNVFLNHSIKYYDKFMITSPSYTEWIKRYNGNDKIQFIPLGFENERWTQVTYKQQTSFENIEFILVAVLQFQIDILPFIKAIANNTKYNLTIVGEDGKGQRYNEVMGFIKKNGVNNVRFIGRLEKHEVQEYLKNATIGVSPIISQLLPNKFFDYLACFLPILNIGNEDTGVLINKYKVGWNLENDVVQIKKWLDDFTVDDVKKYKSNILKMRDKFERNEINNQIYNFTINKK